MAMTEKQGGSDVRANTTTATPLNGGGPGAEYEIVGPQVVLLSAPMSDLFLVLAQTDEGLSCFCCRGSCPTARATRFQLQRLKDKLGNRSNASREVEFHGAWARMVGEPGRGVPTIIEMVGHTRLDCVIGAAARDARAVAQAIWHAVHRSAFGKVLVDQPLMRNVLADLARRGRGDDRAGAAPGARLRRRPTATRERRTSSAWRPRSASTRPASACPTHAFEALECLGGNGYVEESGMPRLYREAPLSSIWEGSGNVWRWMCCARCRARPRRSRRTSPSSTWRAGATRASTRSSPTLRAEFADRRTLEHRARIVVERMGLALQAALLIQHAPHAVADAFIATRLAGAGGVHYGTLPAGCDIGSIIERHAPQAGA